MASLKCGYQIFRMFTKPKCLFFRKGKRNKHCKPYLWDDNIIIIIIIEEERHGSWILSKPTSVLFTPNVWTQDVMQSDQWVYAIESGFIEHEV